MRLGSQVDFNGPNYAIKVAQLQGRVGEVFQDFGQATAGEASEPGAVAAIASLQLVIPSEAFFDAGGNWGVVARAHHKEKLAVSTQYCSPGCVDSVALGIDVIVITFHVHASGGVTAFKSVSFGMAKASVSFDCTLTSSFQSAITGGAKEREMVSTIIRGEGEIASSSATLKLRPGETVELSMNASAGADVEAPADPSGPSYTAMADFSHTFRWGGVTEVHAFDAAGNEVTLSPGGRFKLMGEDSHHDYWFASPGIGCDVPPLDGSDPGAAGAGGTDHCGSAGVGGDGGTPGVDDGGAPGSSGSSPMGGGQGGDTGGTDGGEMGAGRSQVPMGGSGTEPSDAGEAGAGARSGGGTAGSASSSGGTGNRSLGGKGGNGGGGRTPASQGGAGRGPAAPDDGSCGCRVPSQRSPSPFASGLGVASVLLILGRRRGKRMNRATHALAPTPDCPRG